MIPESSVLRIARPTDDLVRLARMYKEGLGFTELSSFKNHSGIDGVMLGHPRHPWHLEFTQHDEPQSCKAPNHDCLLVLYIPDNAAWMDCCRSMMKAGFRKVEPLNRYWALNGVTFEDCDAYRVVLQNSEWTR